MAKSGPTGWDIANLGVDIYQTRKISQLRKEVAESNEAIQMQMLQMQMAQEIAEKKKMMLVELRKLVLEIEDELVRIRQAFPKYPAHSAISYDILYEMYTDSAISSDFFEEFHDIERNRIMIQNLEETKEWINSRMNNSILDTKQKMIRYATKEPELVSVIEAAKEREKNELDSQKIRSELFESKVKWENSKPEWEKMQLEIKERREKFSNIAKISIFAGLVLVLSLLSMSAVFLQIPEAKLEQYLSYIIYSSWGLPLLIWLRFNFSPILSKNNSLVQLKNSISSNEVKLTLFEEILSKPLPIFDGLTKSKELINLQSEWLGFVDKNSPRPDEDFKTATQPKSPPKHLFEGPPRSPSVGLTGQKDEHGREWIEYPPGSDKWHFRDIRGSQWTRWRD